MPQLLPTSQQLCKSLIALDHPSGQLPVFSLQADTNKLQPLETILMTLCYSKMAT